jgi:hypothetical protein
LTALPASDISVVLNFSGDPEIRFAASSWNSGDGALEMQAGEVAQGQQHVYQRIYNDDGSYADRLAGSFEWHQGHNHFHFDDYALYTLQPIKGKSRRTSAKTSFCIMDTELFDGTLPGAPSEAAYSQCGNFFQGMSVGWSDTYGSNLPGQEIPLRKLKDGDYRLYVEIDPKDRLVETNEDDNISCVLLRIGVSDLTLDILDATGCDAPGGGDPGGDETLA